MQLVTKESELVLGRSYWAFRKDGSEFPAQIPYRLYVGGKRIGFSDYRMTLERAFELYEFVGPIEPIVPPDLRRYKQEYNNPPENLCMEIVLPTGPVPTGVLLSEAISPANSWLEP